MLLSPLPPAATADQAVVSSRCRPEEVVALDFVAAQLKTTRNQLLRRVIRTLAGFPAELPPGLEIKIEVPQASRETSKSSIV